MGKIIVRIDRQGNARVRVEGVPGDACIEKTRGLEKALGLTTGDETTEEFHESAHTSSGGREQTA